MLLVTMVQEFPSLCTYDLVYCPCSTHDMGRITDCFCKVRFSCTPTAVLAEEVQFPLSHSLMLENIILSQVLEEGTVINGYEWEFTTSMGYSSHRSTLCKSLARARLPNWNPTPLAARGSHACCSRVPGRVPRASGIVGSTKSYLTFQGRKPHAFGPPSRSPSPSQLG